MSTCVIIGQAGIHDDVETWVYAATPDYEYAQELVKKLNDKCRELGLDKTSSGIPHPNFIKDTRLKLDDPNFQFPFGGEVSYRIEETRTITRNRVEWTSRGKYASETFAIQRGIGDFTGNNTTPKPEG